MAVATLFENEHYLIVNKPYDMYINSEDENEKNSVTHNIAKHDSHHCTSTHPLHFVHRLDYATSGVLCIAKNKPSSAAAGKLFEKRETKKYYLAIIRGHIQYEMVDIEYPIAADPATVGSTHKMVAMMGMPATGELRPRQAHTRLLLLETGQYCGDPVSVVLLKPTTGRRHQLRVHCASIGHTILGDYTYSNTEDSAPHRMFLHATRDQSKGFDLEGSKRILIPASGAEMKKMRRDQKRVLIPVHRLVLPLPQETLDIQTAEPFFCDPKLTARYRSLKNLHKFKTREDFRKACENIDQALVIGIKHKIFKHT